MRVTVSENGKRRTLNVCPQDYARLRAQSASPFESLFGGSLFGDDFMSDLLDNGAPAPGGGAMRPRQEQDRQSTDVGDFLSEQAEEILQQAARAVLRLVAHLGQVVDERIFELQLHALRFGHAPDPLELQPDDLADLLPIERVEDDDLRA